MIPFPLCRARIARSGGTTLTITGTHLGSTGNATATVGGVACIDVAVNIDRTVLTCNTTALSPTATAEVRVTTLGTSIETVYYSYRARPEIDTVLPTSGPVAGSARITGPSIVLSLAFSGFLPVPPSRAFGFVLCRYQP